jgi:hypothetical protein
VPADPDHQLAPREDEGQHDGGEEQERGGAGAVLPAQAPRQQGRPGDDDHVE